MAKIPVKAFIISSILAIGGCNPIPIHFECDLPKLTTDIKLEVLEQIGTSSYFSHECPSELSTVMKITRDWGAIKIRLHGSPHRMWMVATDKNNESLKIEGGGAKEWRVFEDYEYAITFRGTTRNSEDVSKNFDISVLNRNNSIIEKFSFNYDVQTCTCASYDAI